MLSKNIGRRSSAVNRNIFRALFCEAKLSGVFGVYRLPHGGKGGFVPLFCSQKELERHGSNPGLVLGSFSVTSRDGT